MMEEGGLFNSVEEVLRSLIRQGYSEDEDDDVEEIKHIEHLIKDKPMIQCTLTQKLVKGSCSIIQNILVQEDFAQSVSDTSIIELLVAVINLCCKHLEELIFQEPEEGLNQHGDDNEDGEKRDPQQIAEDRMAEIGIIEEAISAIYHFSTFINHRKKNEGQQSTDQQKTPERKFAESNFTKVMIRLIEAVEEYEKLGNTRLEDFEQDDLKQMIVYKRKIDNKESVDENAAQLAALEEEAQSVTLCLFHSACLFDRCVNIFLTISSNEAVMNSLVTLKNTNLESAEIGHDITLMLDILHDVQTGKRKISNELLQEGEEDGDKQKHDMKVMTKWKHILVGIEGLTTAVEKAKARMTKAQV